MSRMSDAVALLAVLLSAGCDSTTVGPTDVEPTSSQVPLSNPTGERILGRTALIPIFNWDTGGLLYGSTPIGPALWPAHGNPVAQSQFYIVVYPSTTTVPVIQCYDVPLETCPDHGPIIAAGAMQAIPSVYGGGVLGHDHLSPPHGPGFHVTEYPVLVLFTSAVAANQRLTTKAQVEAVAAAGDAVLFPLPGFSFINAIVNQALYVRATPWVCPAFTHCSFF
jgi:hypothetical protein